MDKPNQTAILTLGDKMISTKALGRILVWTDEEFPLVLSGQETEKLRALTVGLGHNPTG